MNEGNILLGMYVLNASHCSIVYLADDKLMGSYMCYVMVVMVKDQQRHAYIQWLISNA